MSDLGANESKRYRVPSGAIIVFGSIFPKRRVDVVCPMGRIYGGGSGPHSPKSSIFYWGKPILCPGQKLADVHFRGRVGRIELLDLARNAF